MIRFEIVMLALALGVTSVACGGSQAPAKDPSTEPAGPPSESAAKPPPQQESPGLGGTGTGSAQGSGALGR